MTSGASASARSRRVLAKKRKSDTSVPRTASAGHVHHQPTTPTVRSCALAMFQRAGTLRSLDSTCSMRRPIRLTPSAPSCAPAARAIAPMSGSAATRPSWSRIRTAPSWAQGPAGALPSFAGAHARRRRTVSISPVLRSRRGSGGTSARTAAPSVRTRVSRTPFTKSSSAAASQPGETASGSTRSSVVGGREPSGRSTAGRCCTKFSMPCTDGGSPVATVVHSAGDSVGLNVPSGPLVPRAMSASSTGTRPSFRRPSITFQSAPSMPTTTTRRRSGGGGGAHATSAASRTTTSPRVIRTAIACG
jgi:hypothetical protein